jgi:hypothetical protein
MMSAAARVDHSASLRTPPLSRTNTAASAHLLGVAIANSSSDRLSPGKLALGRFAHLCGLLDAMQMPIARLELKKILVDRGNCDSASSTPGRRGADAQPLELVEESMFARVGATVPSAIPACRG